MKKATITFEENDRGLNQQATVEGIEEWKLAGYLFNMAVSLVVRSNRTETEEEELTNESN